MNLRQACSFRWCGPWLGVGWQGSLRDVRPQAERAQGPRGIRTTGPALAWKLQTLLDLRGKSVCPMFIVLERTGKKLCLYLHSTAGHGPPTHIVPSPWSIRGQCPSPRSAVGVRGAQLPRLTRPPDTHTCLALRPNAGLGAPPLRRESHTFCFAKAAPPDVVNPKGLKQNNKINVVLLIRGLSIFV